MAAQRSTAAAAAVASYSNSAVYAGGEPIGAKRAKRAKRAKQTMCYSEGVWVCEGRCVLVGGTGTEQADPSSCRVAESRTADRRAEQDGSRSSAVASTS